MRGRKAKKSKNGSDLRRPVGVKRRHLSLKAAAQSSEQSFPVVGIGASAGGLEAMTRLLEHLPPRTGMSFAFVQHLDPTHESALVTLLSHLTEMSVCEAKNNLPLRPDHLYIIPPNKLLGIRRRRLKLSPRKGGNPPLPIDEFFCNLAEEEGNRVIGVVLSGNGSDGTQGLLAIKAAGGITFAQDEKSAKYPALPGNAAAAGGVDFVLPPERIAHELARISSHSYVGPPTAADEPPLLPPGAKAPFEDILATLRQHSGVDFTDYKRATLQRRTLRRMALHKFDSFEKYAAHLRTHPLEVTELFNDVLIHVTSFFRDRGVFDTLKGKLFPRLVRGKPAGEPIRLWVPGCSTGEEAYSLAIALMEFTGDHKLRNPIQIFGTDIHEGALEKARAGVYPEGIEASVSRERLRRFFVRLEGGHRISRSIRELCIFARQNLGVDPPFSNIDIISCRNVLIYLSLPLQRKVMPLFHYALRPAGFLILGASETAGNFSGLFGLHDKKAKIFARKAARFRQAFQFGHAPSGPRLAAGTEAIAPVPATLPPSLIDVQKQADRVLLTHFSPAGVIVNRHLEVQQFRGQTSAYLEHAHGEASLNLLKMARDGLLPVIRAATAKAIKQNIRVRRSGGRVHQNGRRTEVVVEVVPFNVAPTKESFYLILFEAAMAGERATTRPGPGKARFRPAPEDEARHARLAEELAATRESLQATIQEQEGTNEELRSANEEILSNNEELQSTNEELETAKEELQSTNEELSTVNDELESRNTELEQVNNDLHNILNSVNIPIIILGADLRIRRITGLAEKLFNLIPGDVGRPITDINLPLELPDLPSLVAEVIDSLAAREIEVKDRSGHWYSIRIRPYRTTDNKIDGAVLAFVDIDIIKASAELVSQGRAFADAVINTVHLPILVLDQDLIVQAANQTFYRDFRVKLEETLNQRIYSLGNGQWKFP